MPQASEALLHCAYSVACMADLWLSSLFIPQCAKPYHIVQPRNRVTNGF